MRVEPLEPLDRAQPGPPRKRWIVRRLTHDFAGNEVPAGHDVYCYTEASMERAVGTALGFAWLHEAVEVLIEDEWSPGEK